MFASADDDPVVADLARMMIECRFTEVVLRTAELGTCPVAASERPRWRLLLYIRSVALVNLLRYDEAEVACQEVLASADADGDGIARVRVLGYGIAAAFFQGKLDESLTRLDEVLAAVEVMEQCPERTFTLVAVAIATGIIGLSELSDRLMAQVVEQVAAAPAGVVHPGVMLLMYTLLTIRRCQLAIALEQRDPERAADLYRSVLDLSRQAGVDAIDKLMLDAAANGTAAIEAIPERPAAMFVSHWSFAKVALGESDGVGRLVETQPAPTGTGDPLDVTVEIMWGLCRLRLALNQDAFAPGELERWDRLARRLTDLAMRLPTLALRAECVRLHLAVARRGDDPLLRVALDERYEAAMGELDWAARLEWASFSGFRSRTMRAIREELLDWEARL